MSDDTTAALQALIKQVETLTTTMTDQAKRLDDLHSFNARVLDEKKDIQRTLNMHNAKSIVDITVAEQKEQKMHAAGLERQDNGTWKLAGGGKPVHSLTRVEARDPRKYAQAKAASEQAGVTLTIIDESDGDPTIRNLGQPDIIQSKTFTFDDTHERIRYVRADMHTGNGIVQRQLAAEREGFKVRTFRSLDDLPAHARTKFELMERAANADSDS